MVVVPEPSVKGGGAFCASAVDRSVGPAGGERSDEPLGLAVGLGTVDAGAKVPDAEGAAGDRVDRGAVRAAIVGEGLLNGDAVAGVERDGPARNPMTVLVLWSGRT